jgi:hypothetical protein
MQRGNVRFAWLIFVLFFLASCGADPHALTPTVSKVSPLDAGVSPTSVPHPTSVPAIKLGPQSCPADIASPSHWQGLIPALPDGAKVESVHCGYLMGVPALQAVVNVREAGTGQILDVSVYDKISDPQPTKVFALTGLSEGQTRIGGYNTLLTAEVDQHSQVNKGKSETAFVQDLSREFKWSESADSFVPVAFPGIFPDITRYQAESDQQAVNQGQAIWKMHADQVASNFATSLLQWPDNSVVTVLSGGGPNDGHALVSVKNPKPAGGTIKLTMDRLENNTNGGIWIVTDAASEGTTLTQPNSLDQISSPVEVSGKGNAFEGVVGKVFVLDHNYNQLGTAQAQSAPGAQGNGNVAFSTHVSYTSTFTTGLQDGLVALYTYSNADGSIAAVAMTKVLIK